jgi:hypothetical protein
MKFISSIFFAILFQPTVTWELCERACGDEYHAALEACERFQDPADEAESLKTCIENAEANRGSCFDKCGR